ncbi:hypothetical protein FGK63_18175 [Ruegeria sediminis]|uniref:Transcriptional regulator n=1 Tax=Ruegeria sediminis TaxID=2583820 RepID=A0ABY2WTX6_9RHOB|nr:hypothetical protein [Ruegeria sediminis]TMV04215.1 hypothetical protein FGK63_18175 [Ruegeria sediminis]
MITQSQISHVGLPWPDGYLDLRPVLQEQWRFDEEIYLHHKLSGKSGAEVYAADIHCDDFSGQAILKFDRAPDPEWDEMSEAERHETAFEAAPEFAKSHLPRILKTGAQGDRIAILSSIAGRGLEYAKPWAECSHDTQVEAARLLSTGLLNDWNAECGLSAGLVSVMDLLDSWLGYRLDPKKGRLVDFVQEECGIPVDESSFIFEGRWYPNPLALTNSGSDFAANQKLRAVTGNVHGDLHGYNVLVSGSDAGGLTYHLIDLALYQDNQFLFYDHAYFELSHLLLMREKADSGNWDALLGRLSSFDNPLTESALRGDDLGLVQVIECLRSNLMLWVDRNQSSRLSYMEAQSMLARVAVGLNFANKPISGKSRRMAFLYAAANLKDFMKLTGSRWPKHGPLFVLGEDLESAGSTGNPAASTGPNAVVGPEGSGGREAPATLPAGRPSVAVLAFENMSGDPDHEYFSDGFSQELITYLSSIDWLMVISRGSSFTYKGQSVSVKQIKRELGVDYVVEGSVRRAGSRVRISVQLIDAGTSHHIWAERYDRDADDIFDLQEEIAQAIATNIDSKLKVAERERARYADENLGIWHKFQHAIWHYYKFSGENKQMAQKTLRHLVEEVPLFAEAHVLLSLFDCRDIMFFETDDPDASLERAHHHARLAVSLDDRNSLAKVALSRVFMFQGKRRRAISQAELAVALNPSSTVAHLCLAAAHLWNGHAEDAVPIVDTSIRLSPKGPYLGFKKCGKALCLYMLGDDKAADLVRSVYHDQSLGPVGLVVLAATLSQQELAAEAQQVIRELLEDRPDVTLTRILDCWRGIDQNYLRILSEDLRRAGMPG